MIIFNIIFIFLLIEKNKAQIQYYPKLLANDKYPFALPSTCNDYYYFVIASVYIIKINKETDQKIYVMDIPLCFHIQIILYFVLINQTIIIFFINKNFILLNVI